jgi:diguanylate cyclase (GGDEF)-like protein
MDITPIFPMKINRINNFKSNLIAFITNTLLVVIIGIIDFYTGYQISFSIFYLIPIVWVTWRNGRNQGLIISFFSMIAWLAADLLAEHFYASDLIPYWNAFMRFCVYVFITILISKLKKSLEKEKSLARIDHLTQTANSRWFLEELELEKRRAYRYNYPFTLVYIDLDDFKQINDTLGHQIGDRLLQQVSEVLQKEIRETDMVSRLGGDEFALLLPRTDKKSAEEVLNRVKTSLKSSMERNEYPLTFSIGSATFIKTEESVDNLITKADNLMYRAKKSGKDKIKFEEYISSELDKQ